jgi:hypothetical protein
MAYRNGTYVAFHAAGTSDPTASDMKYYNLLKAWHVRDECDFAFINSHDKTAAVRDVSLRNTLRQRLAERLRNSKNMVLILGATTRFDTDWVPFEIEYAVDTCEIPIVAAYPGFENITNPAAADPFWPAALRTRINNGAAHVIHVPFKQSPLTHAVSQFSHEQYPHGGGLGRYDDATYRSWGLL